jgi:hypothetical protein
MVNADGRQLPGAGSDVRLSGKTVRRSEVMLELVSETVDDEVDVSTLYAVVTLLLVRYHRRQVETVLEAR